MKMVAICGREFELGATYGPARKTIADRRITLDGFDPAERYEYPEVTATYRGGMVRGHAKGQVPGSHVASGRWWSGWAGDKVA